MVDAVYHVMPAANFILLVCLVGYVFINAPQWKGPVQHERLIILEEGQRNLVERIHSMEQNQQSQFETMDKCMEGLRIEVRRLVSMMGHYGPLATRLTKVESTAADVEQGLQQLLDLGCGHPDCPRMRQLVESPPETQGG